MNEDIIINESFSDDEISFENVKKIDFDSNELLNLKIEASEISKETQIKELIAYPYIKKNLTYELPHQPDGALRILRDFNGNALLADEVGLGKTITTGLVLRECIERGFVKKALILTPPSLVDQWVAELREKFELNFNIIENEADWNNVDLAIASLDRVKIFDKEVRRFRHEKAHSFSWDLLIVDEAHKLKDRRTMRWKFVDKIQKKRFLILTATPFQNDLIELYNLLNLLKRGHLGTMNQFRSQFLDRGNKRIPMNPRDLKRKLDEVMVRRKRADTTVSYMKRIPRIISVKLSKEEYEIYEDICELLKSRYFTADGDKINGKLAIYAILPKITSSSKSAIETLRNISENERYHSETRQVCMDIIEKYNNLKKDSKIEILIEVVEGLLKEDKNQKILIYTKHPTTLRYISEKLKPYNLKIMEFMGGLDREEKTRIIKEFKESANILISTETGCEGLNFQFCHNLINYDLPWNPMSVEQRIGRIDRIGQKHNMNIFSLATKDTMEEHVVDLIINKMCCIGLVIGELPIILFNLGLDGKSENGMNKIEEMLMNKFIDSKNNLEVFSRGVEEIAKIVEDGIKAYDSSKKYTEEVLESGKSRK